LINISGASQGTIRGALTPEQAYPEVEIRKQLEQIKAKFREEVNSIQKERDMLTKELGTLRLTRQESLKTISRLDEEARALEIRNEQKKAQLAANAQPLQFNQLLETDLKKADLEPPSPSSVSQISKTSPYSSSVSVNSTTATKSYAVSSSTTIQNSVTVTPNNIGGSISPTSDDGNNKKKFKLKTPSLVKAYKVSKKDGVSGSAHMKSSLSTSENDLSILGGIKSKEGDKDTKFPHDWRFHSYLRPHKCDYCSDKLWGKEMKCEGIFFLKKNLDPFFFSFFGERVCV